jgi:hypothetical protein
MTRSSAGLADYLAIIVDDIEKLFHGS